MIAVLFDLDGTLVDSSPGILDSLRHMLAERGAGPQPDEELRRWIGPPLQHVAAQLLGADDERQVAAAVEAFRHRYRTWGVHQTTLFPGIRELLERLLPQVRLGVATSKPTDFARQILADHQLESALPVVCGADWEGRLSKADLIAAAIAEIGADPEQSVMIGDRRFDIEGAQQHGLATVGVTYGFGGREELEEAGADIVCDTVEAVSEALAHFLG